MSDVEIEQPRNLHAEAGVIGLTFAVVYAVVHVMFMMISPSLSMSHVGMFGAAFVAGALGHYLYEYSGWNKQFCDMLEKSQ